MPWRFKTQIYRFLWPIFLYRGSENQVKLPNRQNQLDPCCICGATLDRDFEDDGSARKSRYPTRKAMLIRRARQGHPPDKATPDKENSSRGTAPAPGRTSGWNRSPVSIFFTENYDGTHVSAPPWFQDNRSLWLCFERLKVHRHEIHFADHLWITSKKEHYYEIRTLTRFSTWNFYRKVDLYLSKSTGMKLTLLTTLE